MQSKPLWSNTS